MRHGVCTEKGHWCKVTVSHNDALRGLLGMCPATGMPPHYLLAVALTTSLALCNGCRVAAWLARWSEARPIRISLRGHGNKIPSVLLSENVICVITLYIRCRSFTNLTVYYLSANYYFSFFYYWFMFISCQRIPLFFYYWLMRYL